MVERIEVSEEVRAQIEAACEIVRNAIAAKDFVAADRAADEAWAALEEPKEQWEFYFYVLPHVFADMFVRAGAVDIASKWMRIARPGGVQIGEDYTIDLVDARVRAATGDIENAEYIAGTLLKMYGPRMLSGSNSDLMPYAKAFEARSRGEDPAAAVAAATPAPTNVVTDLPMSDGGADTERADLEEEIDRLAEAGGAAFDEDDFATAVSFWKQGLEIIPAPRSDSEAAAWFYISIGDAYYLEEELDQALVAFHEALKCEGATGTGFLWYRLGQTLAELGDNDRAADALMSAYMLEGKEIFADDDPMYFNLIAERANLSDK